MHHYAKFHANRLNRCIYVASFRLLKVRNFSCKYGSESQYASVIVPNFALISQTVAEMWPFVHF